MMNDLISHFFVSCRKMSEEFDLLVIGAGSGLYST